MAYQRVMVDYLVDARVLAIPTLPNRTLLGRAQHRLLTILNEVVICPHVVSRNPQPVNRGPASLFKASLGRRGVDRFAMNQVRRVRAQEGTPVWDALLLITTS